MCDPSYLYLRIQHSTAVLRRGTKGVKGTSFWMYYVGVGVFFPEGEYGKICYQKLESIQPSIFIERKLELLYVELRSTSLS